MQIKVLELFQGKATKEIPIEPGVYDENDKRLFGLGGYLVQHGFAESIPEPKPEPKRRTVKKKVTNEDSE